MSRLVYEKRFDFSRYDPLDTAHRVRLLLMLRQADIERKYELGHMGLLVAAARGGTTAKLSDFVQMMEPKVSGGRAAGIDVATAQQLRESWERAEGGSLEDPIIKEKIRKTIEYLNRPAQEAA